VPPIQQNDPSKAESLELRADSSEKKGISMGGAKKDVGAAKKAQQKQCEEKHARAVAEWNRVGNRQ